MFEKGACSFSAVCLLTLNPRVEQTRPVMKVLDQVEPAC